MAPGTPGEQTESLPQHPAPGEPEFGSYLDEESRESLDRKLEDLFRSDGSDEVQ